MIDSNIFNSFYLHVDTIHNIFIQEYGSSSGVPIIYLHGGPGSGCSKNSSNIFDPNYFRVILVDQRGSGKSTPLGCIQNNTIEDLTNDIEKIRKHLDIEKWHVFGGSWGSTLALNYAIEYRQNCLSMILRGICLFEDYDINWWLYDTAMIFPDTYMNFVKDIKIRDVNLLDFYYDKLCKTDKLTRWNYQWFLYEVTISNIDIKDRIKAFDKYKKNRDLIYSCSRIMSHYLKFCRPNIIDRCQGLNDLPIFTVHGRFDIICPIINAFNLKKSMPNMDLVIAEMSGHSSNEREIRNLLREALDRIKDNGVPTLHFP